MTEESVEEIFRAVAETAPHIYSGLLHRREYVEEQNPSDEKMREADVWANELLKQKITSLECVGEYASEEEGSITDCGEGLSVTVDPLDGSSNIPTNNIVGTVIGIYNEELPCKGEEIVSAFYIVFGPLISIVKAENGEVNEYVIEGKEDEEVEIHLATEDMNLPDPTVYGFGGNKNWTESFRIFEKQISQELKLRYGGSMVGDVNQVLHYGGIFAYPERTDAPEGKLRLLFEGNPMAYIMKTAGGKSSDGENCLLEKDVKELHQRTPVYLGNSSIVENAENYSK